MILRNGKFSGKLCGKFSVRENFPPHITCQRTPGFVSRTVHVEFVVFDKESGGQVFRGVLRFSTVSIISSLRHIQLCFVWGMDNGSVISGSYTETVSPHHSEKKETIISFYESGEGGGVVL
jgi:hypothetical protein